MKEVSIALVGKYTKLEDSYASVVKALKHASIACGYRLDLKVRLQPVWEDLFSRIQVTHFSYSSCSPKFRFVFDLIQVLHSYRNYCYIRPCSRKMSIIKKILPSGLILISLWYIWL